MDKRQKKRLKKTFKIAWIIAGMALLILTIFFFVQMKSNGTIARALSFATGLYSFTIYITVTLILLLIQEIIKRTKEF